MNNNEAKRVILEVDSCFCKHGAYKDCHSGCKYREALDAAVKALEQEPTTKNDLGVDCISRAEAKAAIRDKFKDLPSRVEINTILNALPSVTPQEPKTGHWNDIPKYKDMAWQCSECKHFTTMKHNYCPMCGAKMVEPQESEENDEYRLCEL